MTKSQPYTTITHDHIGIESEGSKSVNQELPFVVERHGYRQAVSSRMKCGIAVYDAGYSTFIKVTEHLGFCT